MIDKLYVKECTSEINWLPKLIEFENQLVKMNNIIFVNILRRQNSCHKELKNAWIKLVNGEICQLLNYSKG